MAVGKFKFELIFYKRTYPGGNYEGAKTRDAAGGDWVATKPQSFLLFPVSGAT